MQQHKRYQELDALRGIAALMVVALHLSHNRPETGTGFRLGITGVDLFFIISGFVIFMSITQVKTGLEFFINRACRLYPAYWSCVTFTFILICIKAATVNIYPPVVKYSVNMTILQSLVRIEDLDRPYWTLTVELFFYAAILILFVLKKLQYVNTLAVTFCIIILILCHLFYPYNYMLRAVLRYISLLQFIPLFFAGITFYKIYTEKNKLVERYLLVAFCAVCQVLMYDYAGRYKGLVTQFEYAIILITYLSLFILFVNHKLTFIISGPTLFFGKISYCLYLIHNYVSVKILIPLLMNKCHLNYWISAFAITLPLIILLAWCIIYYIETPLSKFMRAKLKMTFLYTDGKLGKKDA